MGFDDRYSAGVPGEFVVARRVCAASRMFARDSAASDAGARGHGQARCPNHRPNIASGTDIRADRRADRCTDCRTEADGCADQRPGCLGRQNRQPDGLATCERRRLLR